MDSDTEDFDKFCEQQCKLWCKVCLFCDNSMSADAMDGSSVLVCFNMKGHEHTEMQVDDMFSCKNFN